MELDLAFDVADGAAVNVDHDGLERAARAALTAAGAHTQDTVVELAVRCVDARESAGLNGTYRDKPTPTNVLSFPAGVRVPGLLALGDLVVCLPVVADEATAQGKMIEAHLCHMIVHGVLHLLGFDHIDAAEADIMEDLERRVMARLGYDDPYREALSV